MRLILAALALCTTACGDHGDGGQAAVSERDTVARPLSKQMLVSQGRVIDQPGALAPADEMALGAQLDQLQRDTGVSAAIVLLDPPEGASLELVGWAVGGQKPDGQLLIMVEPGSRQVRIESGRRLSAEQSARVAAAIKTALDRSAMRPALQAGIGQLRAVVGQGEEA